MRRLLLPLTFKPSVPLRRRNDLPPKPGVYYAIQWWNPLAPVVYIGKADSLQKRWQNHEKLASIARFWGVRLYYQTCLSVYDAETIEAVQIARYKPLLNVQNPRLRRNFRVAITDFLTDTFLLYLLALTVQLVLGI
jgi:excinuclease UvrABC nuclease subunit